LYPCLWVRSGSISRSSRLSITAASARVAMSVGFQVSGVRPVTRPSSTATAADSAAQGAIWSASVYRSVSRVTSTDGTRSGRTRASARTSMTASSCRVMGSSGRNRPLSPFTRPASAAVSTSAAYQAVGGTSLNGTIVIFRSGFRPSARTSRAANCARVTCAAGENRFGAVPFTMSRAAISWTSAYAQCVGGTSANCPRYSCTAYCPGAAGCAVTVLVVRSVRPPT